MKAFAIWLTGIPSSGKSTIANFLKKRLSEYNIKIEVLESDEVRKIITPNPKYNEFERELFYRSLVAIGKYLTDNGVSVIFDATAHKRSYREYARSLIKNFIEVYVYCPLEECIKRDVKGLYSKALKGVIKTLPGLQVKYEEPINPDLIVYTDKESVRESVDKIMSLIKERFLSK